MQTLTLTLILTCVIGVCASMASAASAEGCVYAVDYHGNVLGITLESSTTNSTAVTLASTGLRHSFIFTGTISPAHGLATVQGGPSNDYRNVITVSLETGATKYSPTTQGTTGPYFLAADLRPTEPYRLYGALSSAGAGAYQLVEIDPATAKVVTQLAPADYRPNGGDSSCRMAITCSWCGWFDASQNLYVTPWQCANVSVVVAIDVDTHAIRETPIPGAPSIGNMFTVHPTTGTPFFANRNGNIVYAINLDGTLDEVIVVPYSSQVLLDLVVIPNAICLPRAQDTRFGRNHPQGADMVCASVVGSAASLFNIPFIDGDELGYLDASVFGTSPCPSPSP